MKKFLMAAMVTSTIAFGLPVHADQQSNKKIATEFFEAVVNQKDFNKAAQYLGPWYTEHDPQGTDGPTGLKAYIDFMRDNFPNSQVVVKRVIADDNYVIFHVHSILTPGTPGDAVIDMFRLENGKIVEHWDVTQEVPANSANPNGMF